MYLRMIDEEYKQVNYPRTQAHTPERYQEENYSL